MEQLKYDVALGRFLSLVLRHHPEAAGITLDKNGWADVDELIAGIRYTGRKIDRETLERIVRENSKQRYSMNEAHTKIRANQGHSVQVDVELRQADPPDVLYHGTAVRFLGGIKKDGITKQSRQYVHLSKDEATAVSVGSRHGKPVVLHIDARKMAEDGIIFYLSENGVWLCDSVAWKYVLNKEVCQ